MKKLLTIATAITVTVVTAHADIQAPPGAAFTSNRKLGRAISNIFYGISEIPESIVRRGETHGSKAAWSYGLVDGTHRMFRRMGYGFYELFTFRCPTHHGTFKPPYEKCGQDGRIELNPTDGFHEFPPELGAESHFRHNRTNSY